MFLSRQSTLQSRTFGLTSLTSLPLVYRIRVFAGILTLLVISTVKENRLLSPVPFNIDNDFLIDYVPGYNKTLFVASGGRLVIKNKINQ